MNDISKLAVRQMQKLQLTTTKVSCEISESRVKDKHAQYHFYQHIKFKNNLTFEDFNEGHLHRKLSLANSKSFNW